MELEVLFCAIDDFCKPYEKQFTPKIIGNKARKTKSRLSLSEVMTIVVYFHQSSYRTFKAYYQENIRKHHQKDFPKLVSYNRFIELIAQALIPLIYYSFISRTV